MEWFTLTLALVGLSWLGVCVWVLHRRQALHKEQIEFLTEQLAEQRQGNNSRHGINQLMR